jgi:hypothetical protein
MKRAGQLTLGEMITKIEVIIAEHGIDQAAVFYDFGNLYPTEIDSWRGAYSELALSYSEGRKYMDVNTLLAMLKGSIGKTFIGYKGGEYKMDIHTPIWVANYGYSGNTAVVGVVDNGYDIIIETGYREYEF